MKIFDDEVMFGGWGDGHKSGAWIKLFLADSSSLDNFRGMTERKAKQAGQILKVVISISEQDDSALAQTVEPYKSGCGTEDESSNLSCGDPIADNR